MRGQERVTNQGQGRGGEQLPLCLGWTYSHQELDMKHKSERHKLGPGKKNRIPTFLPACLTPETQGTCRSWPLPPQSCTRTYPGPERQEQVPAELALLSSPRQPTQRGGWWISLGTSELGHISLCPPPTQNQRWRNSSLTSYKTIQMASPRTIQRISLR